MLNKFIKREKNTDLKMNIIENLKFNIDDVPTEYTWSGYTKSANEYVDNNFLAVESNKGSIYICSLENGVGLGDYLSNYILKQECVFELECVLMPGYDYWFFQAWEKCEPCLEDLGDWIKKIVGMFIREGLIVRFLNDDTEFLAFSELRELETSQIAEKLAVETNIICEEAVMEHLQTQWDDYGEDVSELTIGDGKEWAQALLDRFIKDHTSEQ